MSGDSGVGEEVLGAVDHKVGEEALTGGEGNDPTAASGRSEHPAASPELSDSP